MKNNSDVITIEKADWSIAHNENKGSNEKVPKTNFGDLSSFFLYIKTLKRLPKQSITISNEYSKLWYN